jgi:glycosyl hydrolase family 113
MKGRGAPPPFPLALLLCALAIVSTAPAAAAEIRADRVVLLVEEAERGRPELARLAADLDRAVGEMAARVPLAMPETSAPVRVAIEPDHVAQAREAGEIGEAVPGPAGARADLFLVDHPDDLFAYRYALARLLVARAGLAGLEQGLPWLARGAALWLSRDWYGRPYGDWLPVLAAAHALPTAADLLAAEEQADGSAPLWTPAAAAVVERLPGRTLAEKLARPPSAARVAAALAALQRLPAPAPPRRPGPPPPFLKGVSLAMLNRLEGGYHAPALDRQLESLRRLGADAVSLMPFAFQRVADAPALRYLNRRAESETDVGLVHATRRARALGFHVLYKPHLWVSHGSWPGEVAMKDERDWALWWQGYRRFVLHHALLARWAGADLFSVGVELSKTLGREREWRDLIAAVRLLFPGWVTYSGNWYGDLERAPFWDRLDLVGVDAYFPLAASPAATRADLDRGAREVVARLAAAARRAGKPVLLTEVGFAARRGAWVEPSGEGGDYSEEDQALAYDALLGALGRPPWLAGTFLWKAFSDGAFDGTAALRRPDFRFLGRQAERVVRRYYATGRPAS